VYSLSHLLLVADGWQEKISAENPMWIVSLQRRFFAFFPRFWSRYQQKNRPAADATGRFWL